MSRTHVSKVLVGAALANTSIAQVALSALADGKIIAFDFDTGIDIKATTKNIAFAQGTSVLGQPIISGKIPIAGIKDVIQSPYAAPVNKAQTLTVTAVPTVGKTVVFKVIYHDNLSIIPNQIKQSIIAVTADAVNTASTTTWAAAIEAAFDAQEGSNLFVTVSSAANVVTFTGNVISTASSYNRIDRPEALNFEISTQDDSALGVYTVATSVALVGGVGDPARVAYAEDMAQGRQGFSDRRSWNDSKKFVPFAVAGETYRGLVINADVDVEGDMQAIRHNPVGAVLYCSGNAVADILTDLAVAGVVPTYTFS
jgi:hypothetical protein